MCLSSADYVYILVMSEVLMRSQRHDAHKTVKAGRQECRLDALTIERYGRRVKIVH
jgi:hypothetical protein